MKANILEIINEARGKGMSEKSVCELLKISSRRVRNWKNRDSLADRKSGPLYAPHALLPFERDAIKEMAKDVEYVDDSHRILAVKACDRGIVSASASSFYREMHKNDLTTCRRENMRRNGNSRKPEREELTGPNQRWCWDISYLRTFVAGIFLYLYVVLDEFSRKVISWRVSWNLTHKEGMELIEDALENENLTLEEVEVLSLYNDRGVQMKTKNFKKMLKDLGITQVFSRPKTPNDNPFVESAFSIIKGEPEYPLEFLDLDEAVTYFRKYFIWYNTERLHGGIRFVTPEQKHRGLSEMIILERKKKLENARMLRLTTNRLNVTCLTKDWIYNKLRA
jgi:putative transposase